MIAIDGRAIARTIERRVKEELTRRRLALSLASLFVGEAADSALYTLRKAEAAARLGVDFAVERLPASAAAATVAEKIRELNERPRLDGYLVQLPLPPALRSETEHLLNLMDQRRDVDGLTAINRQRLFAKSRRAFLPTPVYAVMNVLASLYPETRWEEQLQFLTGQLPKLVPLALHGERAVIVSDGDVFGSTLEFVLRDGGVAATVERSDSHSLVDALRRARLIITAVGKPEFLTGDMIADGSIVIDVGTTLVGGRTVGDAEWESVSRKAAAATPVPGGVGPVTVATIYANLLYLAKHNVNYAG